MKVTIHEYRGHDSKRDLIQALFEKFLHPGVYVTSEVFPLPYDPHGSYTSYGSYSPVRQTWTYIKLLQAATPPENGIRLDFNDPFSGLSPYIKAYFALTGYHVTFDSTEMSGVFFPAISVQDRMVMVPRGLGAALSRRNNGLPTFPAFGAGGVLEVNFLDPTAVRSAVRMVSDRAHADFFKDLQSYARFQDLHSLPLPVLADDLNTDLSYIQYLLRGDEHVFDRASYKYFEWAISPEELPVNRWTKVTLSLKNNSDQELDKLSIELRGPVKVSPERIELTVAPRSSAETLIAIKPEESGDYPLGIVGVLPQDRPLVSLIEPRSIWVKFVTMD